MLKKKVIPMFLSFFMVAVFLILPGKAAEVSAEEFITTAACQNLTATLYAQDNVNNRVTYRITGTPGNMISLHAHKFPSGDWVTSGYTHLPSNGVYYMTLNLKTDGTFTVHAVQESPCFQQTPSKFISTF